MDILTGIIAGILTIIIVEWIGLPFYKNSIMPCLENIRYKGIRIDGEWKTTFFMEDERFTETAKITQKGHIIKGTILYQPPDDKLEEFEVDGEFENLLLTAKYRPKDTSSLDRGTFALIARNDGKKLEGYLAFYSIESEKVIFGKYIWIKQ
jgi:hypothetical protein